VVGPALPLSSTSTFTTPSKHPKGQILVGANISRGKWEGQIIFLGVNIYPYHPNSTMMQACEVNSVLVDD
jgi:hypothetical protein